MLFLQQWSSTTTILKHYKTLSLLCHPDKGGWEHPFKIVLQVKNIMEDKKDLSVYLLFGLEKAEEYLNWIMDPTRSFWMSGALVFLRGRQRSNPKNRKYDI